eukprot:m51a1_g1357 putative wd-40 repeat-containing protein (828) ;mRNA; f:380516-383667
MRRTLSVGGRAAAGRRAGGRAACILAVPGPDAAVDVWVASTSLATITAYECSSGKEKWTRQAPAGAVAGADDVSVCMCGVGDHVWAGTGDGSLHLLSAGTGELVRRLPHAPHGPRAPVTCMAATQRHVWTGGADRAVVVWDRATGEPRARLVAHKGWVRALASVGRWVWSASDDGSICVWDEYAIAEGKLTAEEALFTRAEGHAGPVLALAVCGTDVWSGSADSTVRVWDSQGVRTVVSLRGHKGHVTCLAASSTVVWSGSVDRTVVAWDARTHKMVQVLHGHGSPVWSLVFVEKDRKLWSGGGDGSINVWEKDENACSGPKQQQTPVRKAEAFEIDIDLCQRPLTTPSSRFQRSARRSEILSTGEGGGTPLAAAHRQRGRLSRDFRQIKRFSLDAKPFSRTWGEEGNVGESEDYDTESTFSLSSESMYYSPAPREPDRDSARRSMPPVAKSPGVTPDASDKTERLERRVQQLEGVLSQVEAKSANLQKECDNLRSERVQILAEREALQTKAAELLHTDSQSDPSMQDAEQLQLASTVAQALDALITTIRTQMPPNDNSNERKLCDAERIRASLYEKMAAAHEARAKEAARARDEALGKLKAAQEELAPLRDQLDRSHKECRSATKKAAAAEAESEALARLLSSTREAYAVAASSLASLERRVGELRASLGAAGFKVPAIEASLLKLAQFRQQDISRMRQQAAYIEKAEEKRSQKRCAMGRRKKSDGLPDISMDTRGGDEAQAAATGEASELRTGLSVATGLVDSIAADFVTTRAQFDGVLSRQSDREAPHAAAESSEDTARKSVRSSHSKRKSHRPGREETSGTLL